ncbi:MAG: hypothetical protein WD512_12370 [Candidatus Paceibacterota bacterium]
MKTGQDLFLIFVIILKFTYIISELLVGLYKRSKNVDAELLKKLEYYNEHIYIISQISMFLLLVIIFRPSGEKEITVNKHEKLIFFSLGIMGLTHIQYRILFNK